MKYFYLLSIWLCLIYAESASAQAPDNVPQVKPVPPDAAAMFKVFERPLGTYTGTIPISFPLTGLSSGGLSANVSLNYNSTGGVKMEEMASSVGLGFSLSDGAGRITQVVRKYPDDRGNGFLQSGIKPSGFHCYDMYHVYRNYLPSDIDLEPDIYMYNFNGRSGRFFFKENGTVVLMENAGLTVQYSWQPGDTYKANGFQQIIITDEQGNKFYFGKSKDLSVSYKVTNGYQYQNSHTGMSTGPPSSTWYLTECYDKNEENRIQYQYVSATSLLITLSGGFMRLMPFEIDCNGFQTYSSNTVMTSYTDEYIVSRIDANNGFILFNTTEARADGGGRRIDSIRTFDPNGNIKKRFRFNYSYFGAGGTWYHEKRLKLKNFSELGSVGADSLTHRFTYEETQNLPSRIGYGVDLWGFYNGNASWTLCPNVVFDGLYRTDLANRNANAGYGVANILRKITYPTGGYREFVYEGNTALTNWNPGEYHPDPAYTVGRSFTETGFTSSTTPIASLKKTFTVSSTDGGASFRYTLNGIGGLCSSGYSVKIFKTFTAGDLYGGTEIYSVNSQPSSSTTLANGFYRLEVYKSSSGCVFTNIEGEWGECTLSATTAVTPRGTFNINNRNVGGVRIKQIKDYDPVTAKFNTKQYYYKLYSTDSTLTSGLLVSPVKMVTFEHIAGVGCRFWKLSPTSSYPLASEGGSYVVYPEVRTVENGNGWTDLLFSYQPDIPSLDFPIVPLHDSGYARGHLLEEKVYNQSGTLLRKKHKTYVYGTGTGQTGYRSKGYWYSIGDGYWYEYDYMTGLLPSTSVCNSFSTIAMPYEVASESDTTYNGSEKFGVKTTYAYDTYNQYLVLRQQKTTVNGNQTKEINYEYPFSLLADFSFGLTGPEQTMKSTLLGLNYLQPLEITNTITPSGGSPTLLGGTKFSYGYFNTTEIHLASVKNYTTATVFDETFLTAYDTRGNLLEKYKNALQREVYLWGYNSQYPVVKILTSNYTTVSPWVTQGILDNPTDDSALRSHLSVVRTNLSSAPAGAQVSIYTYSPLTGMTSFTDAKGMTAYYEYDNFGRLRSIKDSDGKVVKVFDYHYSQ